MDQKNFEKLGMKQYIAIALFLIGMKATEDTPAKLYQQVENAVWMIPILAGLIFFIPFLLLLKTLSKFPNKDIFSVIKLLLGKYVGFVICILIFIINSFVISLDTRTYANIIRTYYFPTTPTLIIYTILMIGCAYGAKKGLEHIGSVAWIMLFYGLVGFYIPLLLGIQKSTIHAVFPILGSGIPEITKASGFKISMFTDLFILSLVIPYMKSTNEFRKGSKIALIYTIFHISFAFFIFNSLYDRSLTEIGFPFHTTIRFVSFGIFIPNVETIFFPIWVIGAFIRFSALIYLNALMFGQLFKIKDFEFIIPSLATIYLLVGLIPETPFNVSVFKDSLQNITGPMYASFCIFLWVIALFKGEKKHAKNNKSV